MEAPKSNYRTHLEKSKEITGFEVKFNMLEKQGLVKFSFPENLKNKLTDLLNDNKLHFYCLLPKNQRPLK